MTIRKYIVEHSVRHLSKLKPKESEIKFHVSGTEYTVKANDISPETTLNAYLRDELHLTATKKMCLEGGCGTCIVAVEKTDSEGKKMVFAVNSCLVSIFSCHGWKILSNEGIGNSLIGYHRIQRLLTNNNGSQCGFCSSGMVMSMYALSESGGKTKQEIEDSFGGNLCRCTGYRPILTAFKQLATDADDIMEIDDIEDIEVCNSTKCKDDCPKPCKKVAVCFNLKTSKWMKVYNLHDLLEILKTSGNSSYMLVAGNTARGVYRPSNNFSIDMYIDVTGVSELTSVLVLDDSVILGGNVSLTDTIILFRKVAKQNSKFAYLEDMANHLDLVAHVPVRNIGTIAGNLMIKYQHNEFQSDVFLISETSNATLIIVDAEENEIRVSPQEFLRVDMAKKVIKQIVFPAYDKDYYYTSYKIMPRAQNSHAFVNAGFLLRLNPRGVVESARIVYGAINPGFVHATKTETFLIGKQLFDNDVLQGAFKTLDGELNPDWILPDPSPVYRKQLAINLFYKSVLKIAPPGKLSPRNRSGATILSRPVSSGTQQIYSKREIYPLTQPVLKLESLAQTAGQAEYIIDMPSLPGQLHGVLVKAQAIPGSIITNIEVAKALSSPGAVAFYSAKDIPGVNAISVQTVGHTVVEQLFCAGTVQYYSQPVGVIVGTSHDAARTAASLVTVSTTTPTKKPLFTIQDVLKQNASSRITHQTSVVPKRRGNDIKKVITGNTVLKGQYHFHMENQNCLVVPTEDGLNVYAGTQWMDCTQGVISQVLKMPSQKISIFVRRLGGAFGSKLTRNGFVAGAAALAASKLQNPVNIWMNLNDNMQMIGKRYPFYSDYEVGVNAKGVIQYLKANLYTDYGVGGNEPIDSLIVSQFQNCYATDTWSFDTYTVNTDKYAECFARAPGTVEALAAVECIMDHIAYSLNLDPLSVRRANMDELHNPLLVNILSDILKTDSIDKRKADIQEYNKANRWKKKGLSIVPMRWVLEVKGNFTTLVSIYHLDGGVVVSHGGVEMGQGINTKVAQVCAYKFRIPLDKVSVKPSYTVVSPNSSSSGGSMTSESVVYSLLKACDVLLARIKPIRDRNPNVSWERLIQLCFEANVCLSANGFYSENEPGIEDYPIFAWCVLELEVDILAGKHEILCVDILEDVGQSMSPLIDIGQLEGGFIMGLGYFSAEELIYSPEGLLLTDRTWTYYPPGPKDIPQDFRVRFVNNSLNPVGVLKSKATAEPPTCLSISFALAIRNALASARIDASPENSPWFPLDGPSTVEHTLLSALTDYKQFKL